MTHVHTIRWLFYLELRKDNLDDQSEHISQIVRGGIDENAILSIAQERIRLFLTEKLERIVFVIDKTGIHGLSIAQERIRRSCVDELIKVRVHDRRRHQSFILQKGIGRISPQRSIEKEFVHCSSSSWETLDSVIPEKTIHLSYIDELRKDHHDDRWWEKSVILERRIQKKKSRRWIKRIIGYSRSKYWGRITSTMDEKKIRWLFIDELRTVHRDDGKREISGIIHRGMEKRSCRQSMTMDGGERGFDDSWSLNKYIINSTIVDTELVDCLSLSRETINSTIEEEFLRRLCNCQWREDQI